MTQTPELEKFYTYQELSSRYSVCVRTIYNWFRLRRRFKPTKGTVRIPHSVVTQYDQEQSEKARLSHERKKNSR